MKKDSKILIIKSFAKNALRAFAAITLRVATRYPDYHKWHATSQKFLCLRGQNPILIPFSKPGQTALVSLMLISQNSISNISIEATDPTRSGIKNMKNHIIY